MLQRFLGKTASELEALADRWEKYERLKTWNAKQRKTEKEINEFYEDMPAGYLADIYRVAVKNKAEYLKGINAKGLRVLDFGSGSGEYGLTLASQGADVDFYDLKTPAFDFLEWRIKELKLKCKATNRLEDLKKEYDIIICVDVLEHIPASGTMFKMLHNKLAMYGSMIMDTPLLLPLFGEGHINTINGEHIKEAVDDWNKNKINEFINDNYVIDNYKFTKTDVRCLMLYNYNEGTTGDFMERALRKYAKVITNRQIEIKPNGEGILKACKEHNINLIFQVDSGGWIRLPKTKILKACYSIDTFAAPEHIKKTYLYPYDFKFYAQKRFAEAKNEYWLPLGVDLNVYKPRTTRLRHTVAFCGTFLVRQSQAERNKCLKALVNEHYKNGIKFYLGRDYNEQASLRYSEAEMVFNMGINNDINMRFFEAMATGTPQLYNNVDGLEDLGFKAGEHYFEFKDVSDVTKSMYLALNDPEARKKVSKQAFDLVKQHTYEVRIKSLIKTIKGLDK